MKWSPSEFARMLHDCPMGVEEFERLIIQRDASMRGEWIAVAERTPELMCGWPPVSRIVPVLTGEDGEMRIARYTENGWSRAGVTHWFELPPPPEVPR